MRRTLVFCACLFMISTLPALAAGVQFKTAVRQAGFLSASCRASVTAPLSFTYNPFADVAQSATAVVTLTCNPARFLATIAISPGNSTQFQRFREMWRNGKDRSHVLKYNFYTTPDHSVVWGDGTGGSSLLTINQTIRSYNAVIFAKLQYPQSGVTAGEYSDTATITFNVS